MTIVSYAQNFEDVLLSRALADVQNGQYLDIGAQDPVLDSISHAFYLAGWRGTHVEPTAEYAARLRTARPDERVIEAAVADVAGPIPFYEIAETGLSTGMLKIATHHERAGFSRREILVPCVRLEALLDSIEGPIHWMKIDVEGMEPDVLRSWGKSAARPWILVIESTFPNSQIPMQDQWLEEVLNRGYCEAFYDGLSRYFVHESQHERRVAFEAPANIFDAFVVTRPHFSATLLREEIERLEKSLSDEQALHVKTNSRLSDADKKLSEEQYRTTSLRSALERTELSLTGARAEQVAVLRDLAKVEREHRESIERLWRERREAEHKLHHEFSQSRADDRAALDESRSREASARTKIALLEQQAGELKDRVEAAGNREEQEADEYGRMKVHLSNQLSSCRSELIRADALIRELAQSRPSRWRQLSQAMGFGGETRSWRNLVDWSASEIPGDPQLLQGHFAEASLPREGSGNGGNPYLRANTLSELLSWDDLDFVRCAYVTLLGRQPDPIGELYYAERVRRGNSKFEVLWQLRRSSEGAKHDPGIAGLDRALKRSAWGRKPVIGGLVRALFHTERDDRMERINRSLRNEISAFRNAHPSRRAADGDGERHDHPVPSADNDTDALVPLQAEHNSGTNLSPLASKSIGILLGTRSK